MLLLVSAALTDAIDEEEGIEVSSVVIRPLYHEILPDEVVDILSLHVCHDLDVVLLNAKFEGDLLGFLGALLCFGHVCKAFAVLDLSQLAVVVLIEDQSVLGRKLCLLRCQ